MLETTVKSFRRVNFNAVCFSEEWFHEHGHATISCLKEGMVMKQNKADAMTMRPGETYGVRGVAEVVNSRGIRLICSEGFVSSAWQGC